MQQYEQIRKRSIVYFERSVQYRCINSITKLELNVEKSGDENLSLQIDLEMYCSQRRRFVMFDNLR